MHDLRAVRDNVDELRDAMRRRGKLDTLSTVIDGMRSMDAERRTLIQAVEERKGARNSMSHEVAKRKREGANADDLLAQSRALGEEIERLERELAAQETALNASMMEIPNATLPDVPEGDAESNVVVRSWGEPRAAETVRPHWEVGMGLGLIDFERGAKIAGSGFILFRGLGATLVRGLINLMLDLHTREHGYEEVWVPALVNRAAMTGTGQLPKFEDDMYAVRDSDLFLIPTAEVPITNIYRDEIIQEADLPRAFAGYSPCFRREAGAHGKDTRGLIRVHEFDKVELVRYSTPERSAEELEILTGHAEKVLQLLGLPYRVVLLAAGDTGFSSAKTYDLEVFAPGAGVWLEASSCSSFTDFQARRANIRYRPAQGGKPRFVHTLNGSGVAFPRVIAAILEHYQNADGTIAVPDALRRFVGTDRLG
ncbi:MAG TPA: serine--tRNA ligase [Gemmatimonadaceae bacterium]|jgi:seryl-tRNA synthetase